MKAILLIIPGLLLCSVGFGQFDRNFGSISVLESDLKECSFDPEATAAVLLDEGYSDFDGTHGLITWYHRRLKILKEEGRKYADIKIMYYHGNEFEQVDNLQAIVINLDDNGRRKESLVEDKTIFRKKVNKNWTEVTFAAPDVKVGSIIEYKYRIVAKNYGGLRNWTFQSDIPVLHSIYKLTIVPGHEVSYLVQYNPNYKVGVEQKKNDPAIKFEMHNIPALTDEPYMDAREDYVQKVIFQTTKYAGYVGTMNFMSTWREVTKELSMRQDFGKLLKAKVDESQDFITSIFAKSDVQKMHLVHQYVARNFTWNGHHGIIADEGLKALWKTKTGDAAQINLLLINLLKQAGLEAYPMLVSERGHGKVNKEQPFINQFNNVFAVVFVGGKKYYIDGTDRYTPTHIIPYSILNSTAFIVDKDAGGLIDIAENDVKYQDHVTIMSTLNTDGELSGSVNLESKDYARTEKLGVYINHKTDYVDNYLKKGMVNINVDNFQANNIENDSLPFTQQFNFKTHIQTTGEYSFLSLNMFTGLENNPFIVNNRFSNINFGYKKSMSLKYMINLPANYKVDALPKNIKLVNSSRSVIFTREFFMEKSQLMARIRVDIDKTLFSVDEYAEIKDFFKQMVNLMNEQVVLKKLQ